MYYIEALFLELFKFSNKPVTVLLFQAVVPLCLISDRLCDVPIDGLHYEMNLTYLALPWGLSRNVRINELYDTKTIIKIHTN